MPNDAIKALQGIYDMPKKPGNPTSPDIMLPDPLVIGSPETARNVYEMTRQFPQLKRAVNTVSTAEAPWLMGLMEQLDVNPGIHARSGYWPMAIGGFHDPKRKTIGINPRYAGGMEGRGVLAHEFAHAAGKQHGDGPELAEAFMSTIPPTRRK